MARIRTIKPEMWTDEEFVECSSNARLLFVSGLNFASDWGVLPDKPLQLKMKCFPGDNIDVEPLIDELVNNGLWVRRIAPDGAKVLVIRSFKTHQRVDRPTKDAWGDPDEWPEIQRPLEEHSTSTPRAFDEPSSCKGKEWKGREGIKPSWSNTESEPSFTPTDQNPASPSAPRGDAFAAEFEIWWSTYPRKIAKAKALKAFQARRRAGVPLEDLTAARDHYAASRAGQDPKFTQHGSTFLGADGAWADWAHGPPEPTRSPASAAPQNRREASNQALSDWVARMEGAQPQTHGFPEITQ